MKASDLSPELRTRLGIKSRNKYGVADKADRTADGIVFDSKKEMRYYRVLKNSIDAKFFLRQVPFHLPGGVVYRADFLVFWCDGTITVDDVKGFRTKEYRMKKTMVEALYPIKIREV